MELERLRRGEPEVYRLLLRENWSPLVRYLSSFVDGVEAAEDAAQEAFVRLWQHRDRWETGSARAVLFRIGRNVALDARRQRAVRRRWAGSWGDKARPSPPTPEQDLAQSELYTRFRHALESLPERRREVFELARHRGLSYREIAAVLELSEQTVANHMSLALKDLAHLLSDLLPGASPYDEQFEELGGSDA